MTREEARKAAEVMLAYSDGKDVEFRQDGENWDICKGDSYDELDFNFRLCEYRIKKEPTYRPFKDKDECWAEMQKHQPLGWIKNKKDGDFVCITTVCDVNNFIFFYEKSTFADGTPFGIQEE